MGRPGIATGNGSLGSSGHGGIAGGGVGSGGGVSGGGGLGSNGETVGVGGRTGSGTGVGGGSGSGNGTGSSGGKSRRLKPGGAFQGLRSLVTRNGGGGSRNGHGGSRKSLLSGGSGGGGGGGGSGGDGVDGNGTEHPSLSRASSRGPSSRRSSGGVGELSVKAVEKLRKNGTAQGMPPGNMMWAGSPGAPAPGSPGGSSAKGVKAAWRKDSWGGAAAAGSPGRGREQVGETEKEAIQIPNQTSSQGREGTAIDSL